MAARSTNSLKQTQAMPLRNFGLSFSRRSVLANAGVSWRPKAGAALAALAFIVLALVWRWAVG